MGGGAACVRTKRQDRRAEQLQGVPRLSRALQEGHGARARGDQCLGRGERQQARAGEPGRRRHAGRRGARGGGAALAREGERSHGHFRLERGPRGGEPRQPEKGAVPRLRAAHRQDRVGERQPLHLPPAPVDLHPDRDADPAGSQARQEALGDRLSQLRVRPVGDGRLQEAVVGQAAGRRVRHRAGDPARQDRRRRGGAGARRRQARRDLQLALRRGPAEIRARLTSQSKLRSRASRNSTRWPTSSVPRASSGTPDTERTRCAKRSASWVVTA